MATKKIICALHEKNTSQTGLFGIGQDSLVFAGESPSATLEIWSKIVHWSGIIEKVIYLARGSLTMHIEMLALARGIGHQRLLKVI